ncbi:FAD-dependent oxidoreductase, partial [Salmonella enterica]|uniref:FAD-dependent oxidoreductase n=1 Tax=Salmonella enterica TaxID=28901 RepID=UPI003299F0FD
RIHRKLAPAEVLAEVPGLKASGLMGALHFFDAQTCDARLVWELILGGRQAGGAAYNYTPVTRVKQRANGLWEVTVQNHSGDE